MKQSFKDLIVYRKAFNLAMKIFDCSKLFPKEETYSLTDQIRRSSRSVCASIAEVYRKRSMKRILFPKHQMLIWKIQKLKYGYNLLWNVII